MEIEIKISGLESLAAAVKEAADMNFRAARIQAESRDSMVKGITDALTVLLPAVICGQSPARAFEPDTPEAETPAPAAEASQPRPAADPGRSQAEAVNPVAVTAKNTSTEGAPAESPASARDGREARRVAERAPAEKPPFDEKPEIETPKQAGAAAETPQAVTMSDVMAVCEGLKKDFPAIFTREFSRKFASEAFAEAGLSKPPVTPDEVSRLFEVVSRKETEFRKANHG